MASESRDRLSELYHAALERAPDARRAFVREACGDDEALRFELESLLGYVPAASAFLETPVARVASDTTIDQAGVSGRRLGPYAVTGRLGAGGMGEVYRARDTRLDRDVAIKILPPHFTSDPERRARFAREARLLATLNHPHIGAIYGLEDIDDGVGLVLELVEGPTLADRLVRGPLGVTDALTIGRQITEALDAAHAKGIVHRDLKPANVVLQGAGASGRVTSETRVKILDFGLARPTDGALESGVTDPNRSFDRTADGRILGTPAYMSPEQARGLAVDKRTDIWAFGCVLFEMLSGGRAFGGDTMTDTLARILEREPDWGLLPRGTPPPLVCMAYVSAAVYDAVVAIEGVYAPYGGGIKAPAGASPDAAVIEAAYRTLVHYLPGQVTVLNGLYTAALAGIQDGQAKSDGLSVGQAASSLVIAIRTNDGRMALASTSEFPLKNPGPGVWRLTPTAYAAPQTPWVGTVTPFLVDHVDRFLPDPPPSLLSFEWVEAYNEVKDYGSAASTRRTPEQTNTARFWTANVIRQYNRVLRDLIDLKGLSLLESARLQAMVNMVAADAQIAVMHAKYHYLFWRPVTAIDPGSVKPSGDGFGPFPTGFDDGNSATTEAAGWRPIAATPNHPEYPAAHGSITSALAEVFGEFLGTNRFDLPVHGFDPAGGAGNLDAIRSFRTPAELRNEIVDARVWAGFHYRFSGVEGVVLGRKVARSALRDAFRPID